MPAEYVRRSVGAGPKDGTVALFQLFDLCVPCARHIFAGVRWPARVLCRNHCVMEKAFVYGITLLSKWLTVDRYPGGYFDKWPPGLPSEMRPALPAPVEGEELAET